MSLRYDLGGDHPLVGRSAPDFAQADGIRLNEHIRQGPALLLNFGDVDSLKILADRYPDRVTYLWCDATDWPGLQTLVIRPMVLSLRPAIDPRTARRLPEHYRNCSASGPLNGSTGAMSNHSASPHRSIKPRKVQDRFHQICGLRRRESRLGQ
ncbi:hypothetical protein [Novosphingobium sp. PhB55]|uniref:hypothetical protein n=1 Tax=Novosphingobium sp. PhB55 TaxID=2485106 RepID=UPI001AB03200|nr:hypothetical protein [Novosphingobium sp. PhB55]